MSPKIAFGEDFTDVFRVEIVPTMTKSPIKSDTDG